MDSSIRPRRPEDALLPAPDQSHDAAAPADDQQPEASHGDR